MGHFYFVRHGESLWNVENKICGSTDIDLTDKGFAQASQAAQSILDQQLHIDMIISSPLKRALHTAEVIAEKTGIPLMIDDRITEQNFGRYEGTPRNGMEFRKAKENFIDSWDGGETMFRTAHRVYSLLDEITSQGEKVYLIAAHNGLARIIQSYFTDMTNAEFAAFGIGNCEIRRFDYQLHKKGTHP